MWNMSQHAKIMTYYWRKSLDLFVVCQAICILLCYCHFSSDCDWALLLGLLMQIDSSISLSSKSVGWIHGKIVFKETKNCREEDPYSYTFAFIALKWHEPYIHIFSSYTAPWGQDVDLNFNPKYLIVSKQFINILSTKTWM